MNKSYCYFELTNLANIFTCLIETNILSHKQPFAPVYK